MHQHSMNSVMSKSARCLKAELQTVTRQIQNSTAENTMKEGEGRGCMDNSHITFDENVVDNEHSYRWLKFGDTKGETENTIVAAQDQGISKNYSKNKILKEETDSK